MRHSTHIFLVMEPTQVQTHQCAPNIVFPIPLFHHRIDLRDYASYIVNVYRNQNQERNCTYLQPYLYRIVLKDPSLQYASVFDATTYSFLQIL